VRDPNEFTYSFLDIQVKLVTNEDPRFKGMGESGKIEDGGMAEWLKAAVLKTVSGVTRSGVRIPLPPPDYLIDSR
jgi:hypothetical protein